MLNQLIRTDRMGGNVLFADCIEGFPCLTVPAFSKTDLVEHLFTTRLGGVSEGIFSSCNLSFSRGDEAANVTENYRRVAKALHCELNDFVATRQTHTANVLKVTGKDRGKGVCVPTDYEDIDGLITDEEDVVLSVFTADCVPILFLDQKNKAIGVAHSGWRGTVQQISVEVLRQMKEAYGSEKEDFLIAIGPSICQSCYEVSEDVAMQFLALLEGAEAYMEELRESSFYCTRENKMNSYVIAGKEEGKYQLDLWLANMLILRRAGIKFAQMTVTDVCTCHNEKLMFSHRASQGKRGNLGGFIKLKKI